LLVLHRDYETRSTVDLKKSGAHVYAQHPSTEILKAVWIFTEDGKEVGEPIVWTKGDWLYGEHIGYHVRQHIESGGKVAGHNAAFEQAIDTYLAGPRLGWPVCKPEQLDCTMARAAVQAIPLDLARACSALGLPYQKDKEGHRLMLLMCKPRKPKKGEDPAAILWHETPEQMERLGAYCVADVRAEIGLDNALMPMQEQERPVWLLDQVMNNRGVRIDQEFIGTAIDFVTRHEARANGRLRQVTGGRVEKVTQIDRLKEWLKDNGVELKLVDKVRRNGEEYESEAVDKEAVIDLLAGELPNEAVREALEIRRDYGKSSVKKFAKFKLQSCQDGRARGNLQYHAAGPGRWAGRGIQLQNMVRLGIIEAGGWAQAFRDMRELGDDMFELVWGSPVGVASRMSRGAVIAEPGNKLIFGDYSNVEARGCVWAAKQDDMVALFASDGLIYETMGSAIFDLSVEEVSRLHVSKENTLPRFVGKETVLGCGYGMGPPAFQRNAKKKGNVILPIEICQKGVYGWREANPRIADRKTGLWRELEDAAKAAIERPGAVFTAGPFSYRVKGRWLQCRLPSGRLLWYRRPSIKPNKKDAEDAAEFGETVPEWRWKIHYWGVNGVTKQWEEETTWGGKLLENCIQGMCRDFLAGAMSRLEAASYFMVLSVHDEAIAEVAESFGTVKEFLSIMTIVPRWAPGFPLKAEGGQGPRYAKG
jgi:DNA polymerase bacteriophage-type